MTGNVVKVILEPGSWRQLGEEGLLVFWRDAHEPGLREGLACMLSVCPQPDCPCELVHVDGFVIEGQPSAVVWDRRGLHQVGSSGRVTLEARMFAIVEPSSGETRANSDQPGETDPALIEWLVSQMDGELLEVLHRYWSWAKGCRPEGPRAEVDLDLHELEEQHLVDVDACAQVKLRRSVAKTWRPQVFATREWV